MTNDEDDFDALPPWDELDPGIVPAVRVLTNAGLITWSSCQGGEGHISRVPFVCVATGPDHIEEDARVAVAALLGAGFTNFSVSRNWYYNDSVYPDPIFPCELSIEFGTSFGAQVGSET